MNQSFGQNIAQKMTTSNNMNNNNAANTSSSAVTTGLITPSTQTANKPMSNLHGTPLAMSSNASKPPTTGTSTVFNWSISSSTPVTTTNQFTNFKTSTTSVATTVSLKTSSSAAQSSQPVSSSVSSGGNSLSSTTSANSTVSMPNFGIQQTSKPSVITTTSNSTLQFSAGKLIPTTSSVQSLSTSSASSSAPTLATTGTTSLSLTSKPTTGAQPQNTTFQQLEELILNKWTAELHEQEKVFLNQATQINIWDKIINENAEKLTQLHTTMEKVKKLQAKMNDDLDVISTHQKDLEMCLLPMEKEDLLSVLKADPNRKNLYGNAKKIDSQIKSMSENLKETIEHINETSRSHDTDDPVIQVGRILNAHMESLRWIDEHTARMQDYFDSLLKVHDDLRRECDLTKHDVY